MEKETSAVVTQIWNDSRNRIKNFIARRIKSETDAEDVLQNVFCKIHEKLPELKDQDKLYSWVFQITRNAIIDYHRERKIAFENSEELLSEIAVSETEKNIEEEVLTWLEPMVGELPDKYREALLLTDIQGLTQKELSEKLDISLSGAKSRVQRAREQLKDVLLDCCHLEFNRAGKIVEYKQQKDDCSV